MSANPGALPGWFQRRTDRAAKETQAGSARHSDEVPSGSAEVNPAATTGGGKDDQTPVVVWEAANRMEAEIVVGRLHSENIPAIIRGDVLGAIYGLTTGSLAAATVLVPAALAEKALELLASAVEWDEVEQADSAENDDPEMDANPNHHD
jgi:hypothetical protein